MSKEDIATIELIVRQQWYASDDPQQARFGSWLEVDQDQALALLEMIPRRLPVVPRPLPVPGSGQFPGCFVGRGANDDLT